MRALGGRMTFRVLQARKRLPFDMTGGEDMSQAKKRVSL
jgi:hypothetical protein